MKPVVRPVRPAWLGPAVSLVGCGRQHEQLKERSGALTAALKVSTTAMDMMTDAPRSHTPDIELGTHLGSVILPPHAMSTDSCSQPLPNLPKDTCSTPQLPIDHPRVRALIYRVTPTMLLSTMPRSNLPQTPRVSHLISLPLLHIR